MAPVWVSCFMSGNDETHTQFPVSATKLSGTSVLQAALAALLRQDVITREGDRWVVVDSLMREWIARRTY